jgi:hypothetical protein
MEPLIIDKDLRRWLALNHYWDSKEVRVRNFYVGRARFETLIGFVDEPRFKWAYKKDIQQMLIALSN